MPANSVLEKAPYTIPTVVDTDRVCVVVPCPNDPTHLSNLYSAIASLGLWSNYHLESDRRSKPVADVWLQIFEDIDQSMCPDMCDCIRFVGATPQKFVSDGHGGGTWENIDPRTEGNVPPPWPDPPSGQTGNCLSGANLSSYFGTMMGDAATKIGLIAEVAALLVTFQEYLALALGPIGAVIEIATDMAAGAIAAGATVMATAFDTATQTAAYDGIRCLMECAAASDGGYSLEAIGVIKAGFYSKIDAWVTSPSENVLWRIMFPDFLDSQGPNGLNILAKAAGVIAFDCSDCDCGWTHKFDFATGEQGWTPFDDGYTYNAVYTGHSWINDFSDPVHPFYLQRDFPSNRDITSVTFDFQVSVAPGSSFLGFGPTSGSFSGFNTFPLGWDGTGHREIRTVPTVMSNAGWCLLEGYGTDFDIEIFSITFRGEGTDPF